MNRQLAFAWLRESDWGRWAEMERPGEAPDPGKDYADWLRRYEALTKSC